MNVTSTAGKLVGKLLATIRTSFYSCQVFCVRNSYLSCKRLFKLKLITFKEPKFAHLFRDLASRPENDTGVFGSLLCEKASFANVFEVCKYEFAV